MRILVVGGVHGDEQTGIKIVHRLTQSDFNSIDTLIANPDAVYSGCRFIETDLNKSFGAKHLKSYEEKLPSEILNLLPESGLLKNLKIKNKNNLYGSSDN